MTCEVKEAKDQPGICWIEDEKGGVVCDFYCLKPFRPSVPYPNAKQNADDACRIYNEREDK